jgi:hypothetical protein
MTGQVIETRAGSHVEPELLDEDEVVLYGLVAEFANEEALLHAAQAARAAGYRRMDAYTPFPVEGLSDIIDFRKSRVPLLMLLGGIAGGLAGYALQYWASVINYPLNIGGRPLHSAPMFIPVTFETTILVSAIVGVIAMIALNGLPAPYHPLFNVAEFARASQDRFFLAIEATDPQFDPDQTRAFLAGLGADAVHEVEP